MISLAKSVLGIETERNVSMKLAYYWSKAMIRVKGKAIRGSKIDKSSKINYGSNVVNSSVGRYTYCGYDCWIIESDIGAFCSISNNVRIGGPAHPIKWVSSSPVFCKGKNILNKNFAEHSFTPFTRTSIGNDVWIGECTMIKAGVKIGNGAVIGMGSVVTKDIGDYEIWAGNPARFIRKRFDDDIIRGLIKSKWWDKPDSWLEKYMTHIPSPENFIKEISNT